MPDNYGRRKFLSKTVEFVVGTAFLGKSVMAGENRPTHNDPRSSYVFAEPPLVSLSVAGTAKRFPVHRIYCIGLNYPRTAETIGEHSSLGNLGDSLVLMDKPRDAIVEDGKDIPYPQATSFLVPEVELVIAIGSLAVDVKEERALDHVFGYAVGNDLTRRDLAIASMKVGAPVDSSKTFDGSASCGTVYPVSRFGHVDNAHVWLTIDGRIRREGYTGKMLRKPAQLVATLSRLFRLTPGDLIYAGSPGAPVGVEPGETMVCAIDGLGTLTNKIAPPLQV